MQRGLSRAAFVGVIGAILVAQGRAADGDAAATTVELVLHGNTPSLSWSPDSTRVVVNSSFTYAVDAPAIEAHRDSLGVWVVDARSGAAVRVGTEQGYHPLWLDAGTVAWGHSVYEQGPAGVYRSPADRSEVTRVGTVEGVNHTLLAQSGGLMFFSGFPESGGWTAIDPDTGETRALSLSEDSWTRPTEAVDQCPQRVGDVALVKGLAKGKPRTFVVRSRKKVLLEGNPYLCGVGDPWLPEAHTGAVRACLSPDGARVAWFSRTAGSATYTLRVGPVPEL